MRNKRQVIRTVAPFIILVTEPSLPIFD